ncbi:family 10 glycosylhydrolase [Pontibacter cellulosilyticus]|uniref:Family 10 glycosylhydrolase n=1 Tax=Pontibacter cellulosilyticus TaxID=1720253 RepID=A0A923SHU2_9BACT|nr:family 10 glycosylhydrolase [Pontibacter cellulosilyticus]MBC5991912.1 family 10 glycosylhydrolase [Pontibacter cellulosilyticus]
MKFTSLITSALSFKAKYLIILFILCLQLTSVFAQELPNREFRGVWVATVSNLDWPQQGASAETQKTALRTLFDKIKEANLNVVFLQVRTECDAFYNSGKEPWSRFLTGQQGVNPGYDPLAFAIEEAHKRGLELHAWINPFRVNSSTSSSIVYASNHVSKAKPEWLLSFSTGKKILNPGIPEVRNYIASVVQEIAENYAVDGIHFDDYFYPYPENNFTGITTEDSQTYSQFGTGFTSIGDWRRHNINETIRLANEAVKNARPTARFGVSPFGIWKNGTPTGITGMDAYSAIYADALNWLENQYVDYLSPQLYWAIGGSQDYRKLLEWWSDKAYTSSRHLYAGHALYKTTYSEQEVPNQINITRQNRHKNALGDVLYRATNLKDNALNIHTLLQNTTYKYPAAPPAMNWKNGTPPAAPQALTAAINETTGDIEFTWQRNPANSDTHKRYVLYTSATPPTSIAEIQDGSVRALEVAESFTMAAADVPPNASYWVVTELNAGNLESELSNVATVGNVASIRNIARESVLKVYPNPATRVVYLDLKLKRNSLVKVELVAIDGKVRGRAVQKRYEAGNHTITINRDKLPAGIYALVINIDRQRVTKRVVLK